ncbi:MAG: hypothetical protein JW881_08725 [Spirochaetales bacterium]|nr:hypothetical protein [Spirochaetales bacterium]
MEPHSIVKKTHLVLFIAAISAACLLSSCATAPVNPQGNTRSEAGSTSDSAGTTSSSRSTATSFGQSGKSTYMSSSYDDYSFSGNLFGRGLASVKGMQSIKPEESIVFILFYGGLFSALYLLFIIRKIFLARKA